MAIVIPSKHIYDKDNNKIRDNKIDRIEVNATEITHDNKYETSVYNEKIIIENYSTYSEKNISSNVRGFFKNSWTFTYGVGVAKTQITRLYCAGIIKIPKLKNNTLIEKILSKTDNEGNARIKYSSRCTKKTGTVSKNEVLTEKIFNPNSGSIRVEVSVTNNAIKNNDRNFTSEKSGEILPDTSIYEDTISFNQKYTALGLEYSVTSKTTYPDNLTNLGSLDVTYNEENEEYQFEYVLLCGIGFDKLGAKKEEDYTIGEDTKDFTLTKNISLSGETEFYFPDQVEITVYGNTIGIDLTDKIVYIPDESGDKPFSVEGNELMQTSNYYPSFEFRKLNSSEFYIGYDSNERVSATITVQDHLVGKDLLVRIFEDDNRGETYVDKLYENVYKDFIVDIGGYHIYDIEIFERIEIKTNSIIDCFEKTLNEYKNGKETATILCDMFQYDVAVTLRVLNYELQDNGDIRCTLQADNINDMYDILYMKNISVNGIKGTITYPVEEHFALVVYFKDARVINELQKGEITINKKSNFYFNIGDVVIPMVYGANGVDKPMSKYKDGTPKKFKVLGTRIFYDGAVWQELTLQETLE